MVSAKCSAPPSARSSRSTDVTTIWASPSLPCRLRDMHGFVRIERARQAGLDVAEGAGARAGVAHDHEGGVLLVPALADVGAAGLLADGVQAVLADDRVGRRVALGHRRLDADPVGLAQPAESGRCAFSGWRGRPVVWSSTTVMAPLLTKPVARPQRAANPASFVAQLSTTACSRATGSADFG